MEPGTVVTLPEILPAWRAGREFITPLLLLAARTYSERGNEWLGVGLTMDGMGSPRWYGAREVALTEGGAEIIREVKRQSFSRDERSQDDAGG